MDEEISIIDAKTRNEKIKSFFIDNKKILIFSLAFIIIVVLAFYSFQIYKDNQKVSLSEKFNSAIIEFKGGDYSKTILSLKEVVKDKDRTYSPLALYFLVDNDLIENRAEVNELFDILINKTSLDKEIRHLIIYKKALYNADFFSENELLETLNPVLNSDSVWKSHALFLMAEYFFFKDERQKSKEFFNKIISIENANEDIIRDAQIRLNRDLSE